MDIKITIDIAQLIFTIVGGIYALVLFKQSYIEKKNQFLIDIYDKFYNNKEINEILYSIDKEKQLGEIRYGGKLEIAADKTLRFLDLIGQLIKDKQLTKRDIQGFKYEINIILNNAEIIKYLEWLEETGVVLHNIKTLRTSF